MENRYEEMTFEELFQIAIIRRIEMVHEFAFGYDDDLARSVLIDVLNGKKRLEAYYPGVSKRKRPSEDFFVCVIEDGVLYAVPICR